MLKPMAQAAPAGGGNYYVRLRSGKGRREGLPGCRRAAEDKRRFLLPEHRSPSALCDEEERGSPTVHDGEPLWTIELRLHEGITV